MEIKDIYGWTGRTVTIDLSLQSVNESRTNIRKARNYLGGRGLGVKLMSESVDPNIDPFDEKNLLIFATGPLTGTQIPMSGHYSLITKSPLTKTIFNSNVGGSLGKALKAAGIDILIIKGKADDPIYLYIYDEDIEFISARHIWGKNTQKTTAILENKGKVACIGKAGEKKVNFANIVSDYFYSTGRGGHGAVAGSKNLKAIVVKGTNESLIADQVYFKKTISHVKKLLQTNPVISKGLSVYGTSAFINVLDHLDILPANNFKEKYTNIDTIAAETLIQKSSTNKISCTNCSFGCGHFMLDGHPLPDYDALWAFGPALGNHNLETIIEANDICRLNGVDPITCGATISAYIEKIGHDFSTSELIEIIDNITQGKSPLSQGSLSYLRSIQADNVSMSSKGLEIPGYDPRGILGLALAYATSNSGASHMNNLMIGPEVLGKPFKINRLELNTKPSIVKQFQDLVAVIDSVVLCPYAGFALNEIEIASLMTAVTGVTYTATDLMHAGERIWNLERLFNLQAGFTYEDDTLPDRMFSDDGINKDEFQNAINEYYKIRGWNKQGIPNETKLKDLGIAVDYY